MSAEHVGQRVATAGAAGDARGLRTVRTLALVLLGLTLLLEYGGRLVPARTSELGADRALEILLGARGSMLPPFRAAGAGSEHVGEIMRLGDRLLVGDGRRGLRAALLAQGAALRHERSFDVAGSREEVAALRELLSSAAVGDVLALASSGPLRSDSEEARAELAAVLEQLGARARLGEVSAESWALLALRVEGRWRPLAESYSRESGVALAYVLRPGLEERPPPAEFTQVRAPARSEVFLEEELARADVRTEGVGPAPLGSAPGRRIAGILLPPGGLAGDARTPGRLGWQGVPIGAGAGLVTWVGLADLVEGESAVLSIRVDGEVVHEHTIRPSARLVPLEVDLARFSGRSVALEFRVDSGGPAVLLGRPMLVRGYERSPIEIWATER